MTDLLELYSVWMDQHEADEADRLLEDEIRKRFPQARIREWVQMIMTVERHWLAENGSPIPFEMHQTMQ